jgi:general secretion pathway protein L
MGPRAGLYFHNGRLTFVAIGPRRGLVHMSVPTDENPGTLIRAELDARKLRCRRARVGLARAAATVKILELPSVTGSNRSQMLRFELERHVPFPPEDIVFDAVDQPTTRGGPLRVLVAACERRSVERALRVLEEARLRPRALTLACHDLPRLLGRRPRARRAVWIHRSGDTTDLLLVGAGRVRLSRTVPTQDSEALTGEINASLGLVGWKDCDAVWVSGDEPSRSLTSPALASLGALVCEPPLSPTAAALVARLPIEDLGAGMLALAVAAGRPHPPLDLLPQELRPRRVSVGQVVTAAMIVLTAGLGLGALLAQDRQRQRYLDDLDVAIKQLDPEVRAVEQISADLKQKQRLLAAITTADAGGVQALPLMRELTELLPSDTWLTSLNMDARAIELSGQSTTASQLIPLLEGSPSIERVEFTSPVTKGRDKEQFRIRAAWEAFRATGGGAEAVGPEPRQAPAASPASPATPSAPGQRRPGRQG